MMINNIIINEYLSLKTWKYYLLFSRYLLIIAGIYNIVVRAGRSGVKLQQLLRTTTTRTIHNIIISSMMTPIYYYYFYYRIIYIIIII